jgi:NAD(P)-dependent dehydrogenase (short-subunit alcohol dehydrogenase family)
VNANGLQAFVEAPAVRERVFAHLDEIATIRDSRELDASQLAGLHDLLPDTNCGISPWRSQPYLRELLMRRIVAALSILLSLGPLTYGAEAPDARTMKAVLVTGASTGIGRKITERLAADGYFVYAGARKDSDLQALGAIKNVQAVRLDVTNLDDIEAARKVIEHGRLGLYGLVNNAGVVTIGNVIDTKMEEFDLVMSVNVYGPWRITRAFAPLIIASKGRITNIGSVNGIVSFPQTSAYSMSKHSIEAFTDALAQEMTPLGVQVNVVEPGSYKSDIFKSEVQRSGTGAQVLEIASRAKDPDEVAVAVEQALFEPNPRHRYLVVPNEQQARLTIHAEMEKLVELNAGQRYTYDRDTLVKMLDEALDRTRPRGK